MSIRAAFSGIVHNIVLKNRIGYNVLGLQNNLKCFSSTTTVDNPTEDQEVKKAKKKFVPRITLISNENISITTLEEAQKLSKRRDLKLVKIVDLDTKTQRPVYKLMSGTEYHLEDLKQREERKKERQSSNVLKGEKVVILSSGISEHDLMTHVNKVVKWISKKYEVRFIINGGSNVEKAEKIYQFLEEKLKDDVRILQKRIKGNDIKFQMIPPKKEKDSEDNL